MKEIDRRISAAQQMIKNYESNIRMFESGEVQPDVGELLGNKLLLARKRRQLCVLQGQRAARQAVVAA